MRLRSVVVQNALRSYHQAGFKKMRHEPSCGATEAGFHDVLRHLNRIATPQHGLVTRSLVMIRS